jgi:hypothetical protein
MEILDIALIALIALIAWSLLDQDNGGGGKRSRQFAMAGAAA